MAGPYDVTLLPGDSLGPELAPLMKRVVAAAGVEIRWDERPAGREAWRQGGDPLPADTLASIRDRGVALKGRFVTPVGQGYESPNVTLRKALGLFATVRPVRSCPGVPSRYEGVDLVVVRETTEDVYAGIEHRVVPGVIQTLKVTTAAACERVARFAFRYARRRGRKRITLVHKANIMKRSDGLFLRTGQAVAAEHPDIAFDTIIADNACMQLVRNPQRFDVLLCQNLFGDLLSDLAAGTVGGIGAVWGVLRDDAELRVFEAIHGLAPHLEGTGLANPLTFIRPALGLLVHLGEDAAVVALEDAIARTLEEGVRTPDLGGAASAAAVVDAIVARLG